MGDHSPVKIPPYKAGPARRVIIERELEAMLKAGVVRPSTSPWSFPVVIVWKADGSARFCIDYRRLNVITPKIEWPLPKIEEVLSTFEGMQFFSSLDLRSGFWQIPLAEEDKPKTAFTTHKGLYEANVLMFGLKNSPAVFTKYMQHVLAGLDWNTCLVYIDDIIIYGSTFEEHLQRLREVFQRLDDNNLIVKLKKCQFGFRQLKYLGFIVGKDGVGTDPTKTKVIAEATLPPTLVKLQSFMGMCQFYRKFIENFSKIAQPLTKLTRGKKKANELLDHTPESIAAFNLLKEKMTSLPVLAHPDHNKPFFVQTDASKIALGAILSQKDENGDLHPCMYASRQTQGKEPDWTTQEQELLAVKWAICDVFRPYLEHRRFVVETDHNNLIWLHKTKTTGKLARWVLALMPFSFDVKYRPGRKNQVPDYLSRLEPSNPRVIGDIVKEEEWRPRRSEFSEFVPCFPTLHEPEIQDDYPVPCELVDALITQINVETVAVSTAIGTAAENRFIERGYQILPVDCVKPDTVFIAAPAFRDVISTLERFASLTPRVHYAVLAPIILLNQIACRFDTQYLVLNGQIRMANRHSLAVDVNLMWVTKGLVKKQVTTMQLNAVNLNLPAGVFLVGTDESTSATSAQSPLPSSVSSVSSSSSSDGDLPVASATVATSEQAYQDLIDSFPSYTEDGEEVQSPVENLEAEDDSDADDWDYHPSRKDKMPVKKVWAQAVATDPYWAPFVRTMKGRALPEDNVSPIQLAKMYLDSQDLLRLRRTSGPFVNRSVLCVPERFRANVLYLHHTSAFGGGHVGRTKTSLSIQGRFYWPGMTKSITAYIAHCPLCQFKNLPDQGHLRQGKLQFLPTTSPFHTISIDFWSAGICSTSKNQHVLTVVDHLTRWPELIALKQTSAEATAKVLFDRVFMRHGLPERILSDRGPEFMANLYKELNSLLGVHNVYTTRNWAQTNTKAERFHRFLKASLRARLLENHAEWDKHLEAVAFSYRCAVLDGMGSSPFFLLKGFEPRLPTDVLFHDEELDVDPISTSNLPTILVERLINFRLAFDYVRAQQHKQHLRNKRLYDQKVREAVYSPGDLVLLHQRKHVDGLARKLEIHWYGPYQVIKRTSPVNYLLNVGKQKLLQVNVGNTRKFLKKLDPEEIDVPITFEITAAEPQNWLLDSNDSGDSSALSDSSDSPVLESKHESPNGQEPNQVSAPSDSDRSIDSQPFPPSNVPNALTDLASNAVQAKLGVLPDSPPSVYALETLPRGTKIPCFGTFACVPHPVPQETVTPLRAIRLNHARDDNNTPISMFMIPSPLCAGAFVKDPSTDFASWSDENFIQNFHKPNCVLTESKTVPPSDERYFQWVVQHTVRPGEQLWGLHSQSMESEFRAHNQSLITSIATKYETARHLEISTYITMNSLAVSNFVVIKNENSDVVPAPFFVGKIVGHLDGCVFVQFYNPKYPKNERKYGFSYLPCWRDKKDMKEVRVSDQKAQRARYDAVCSKEPLASVYFPFEHLDPDQGLPAGLLEKIAKHPDFSGQFSRPNRLSFRDVSEAVIRDIQETVQASQVRALINRQRLLLRAKNLLPRL